MGATDRRPHATRTHRAQSGPTKLNTNTSLTWIPMEPSFESAVGVRGGRPHSLRSMLLRGAGGGSAHSTFYTEYETHVNRIKGYWLPGAAISLKKRKVE